MTDGTGLTRQTATDDGDGDVVLLLTSHENERLVEDHAEHRTGEIDAEFATVDEDLAGTRFDPNAGDRILTFAGGIGATEFVELLNTGFRRCNIDDAALEIFERVNFGHYAALTFLRFFDAKSMAWGCCASCG